MFSNIVFAIIATVVTGHVLPSVKYLNLNISAIDDERIIGGKEVIKNSFPFTVRMDGFSADKSAYSCGGTLLHENYVVTSAHCVYDSNVPVVGLTLHFGDHDQYEIDDTQTTVEISLDDVYRHKDFDEDTVHNDIAIIKLQSKAPISDHVKPICVASEETMSKYTSGIALGWGLTYNGGRESELLKEVDLPFLTPHDCRGFMWFNSSVMICGGNTEGKNEAICQGDSGGPFIVDRSRPALVGISSFVSNFGCVAVGYGVVFTRVSTYIGWLRDIMGPDLCVV